MATGKTFVTPTSASTVTALCVWNIGNWVLIFVCLHIGLGFYVSEFPKYVLDIFFPLGWPVTFFYLMNVIFDQKKKKTKKMYTRASPASMEY